MQPALVSAIIFDCDGVLVDSEVLALEIEIAVLAEAGLHYDREEFAHRFTGGGHMSVTAGQRLIETGAERLVSGWDELVRELAKL